MKYFLILTGLVSLFQLTASASVICVSGTLASYEALGSGGCTIGSNTVASFNNVSGSYGATEIAPSAVTVTPTGGTTSPTLQFTVSQTASNGQTLEEIFTYVITGAVYSMDTNTLSGSSETGNASVTNVQNYCAGGNFDATGASGCTGSSTGALVTFDGVMNSDTITFPATPKLSITDDFVIDSGGVGTASGGTIQDQFVAAGVASVPEPGAIALSFIGLSIVSARRFYSSKRNIIN